jgi:hypothetical protein
MRVVSEGIEPERFFRHYILKICDESKVDPKENFLQIEYLSRMLSGFVDPEKHYQDSGDIVRVIDVLKKELESVEISIESYRSAADKILFYQSFYPEAFRKRMMSHRFYSHAARSFYRIVGAYKIPVCGMLSEEYSFWTFVLKSMKRRYLF